jgi:hypothetical protein
MSGGHPRGAWIDRRLIRTGGGWRWRSPSPHDGASNAKAYQLWISAIGPKPERNLIPKNIYPWLGFRVGLIGNLGNTTP